MHRHAEILIMVRGATDVLEQSVALSRASTCNVIPEKQFSGTPTVKGEACRIAARARYLIDVLECELQGTGLEECCKQAERDYCAAFDACPA